MDVARSLGAQGRAPNEQRIFVTFAPTKVNAYFLEHLKMKPSHNQKSLYL